MRSCPWPCSTSTPFCNPAQQSPVSCPAQSVSTLSSWVKWTTCSESSFWILKFYHLWTLSWVRHLPWNICPTFPVYNVFLDSPCKIQYTPGLFSYCCPSQFNSMELVTLESPIGIKGRSWSFSQFWSSTMIPLLPSNDACTLWNRISIAQGSDPLTGILDWTSSLVATG